MTGLQYDTEKWGGRPHYRGPVHHLGEDEFGNWFWGPQGRTIVRGDDTVFVTEQDALLLIAPDRWWAPTWWIGHPEIEIYVNINTPASWEGDRVTCVDLDLDVIRFCDQRVEVVDRDEFELHQVLYDYPPELIARTEAETASAFDLVSKNVAPFDGVAAQRWVEHARRTLG